MRKKITMFNQITQLLSRSSFRCIVNRFNGDKYSKKLDCWQRLMIQMILYLLLSFIKFQTRCKAGLLEPLRNIRAVLWEHKSIIEVLIVNKNELECFTGHY